MSAFAPRTAIRLDLIRAYGGSPWAQLFRVRLRAALPSTFAALQIAAPFGDPRCDRRGVPRGGELRALAS